MPSLSRLPHLRLRLRLSVSALLAGACLAALVSAPADASTTAAGPDRDQALRSQLDQLVRSPGGPPGVIAVLQRGNSTRIVRAGVAELGSGRPIEPADHMRIASAAKAFGGAVALGLVDRGTLGLDDTIGRRLPALPEAWHAVTLRQLLSHTSGMPDFSGDPEFLDILNADPHLPFDSRRLLDLVADEPLLFPPGSRFEYSNSDNIAVALMAEAVTGERYEELLRRTVHTPLDLSGTSLPQGYRLPAPYMHGYDVDVAQPPAAPVDVSELLGTSAVWASGGIVSTPADMTRFVRGYASGALISRATLREQRRWVDGASEPAGPGTNSAGAAIFRYDTRCGVVLGHTGNVPGYTQLVAATPDGQRSLTFSLTTQVNREVKPRLLRKLREVEENFVCALLKD
jgi:D-alanyl-D-alanine carboxypeptidase